jgi:D-3-phosphoglycerate dehydrogenase
LTAVLLYSGPRDAEPALRGAVANRIEVRRVEAEPAAVASGLREASAFLDASMKVPIDAGMIAAAPALRVVATATTGADHIDAAALLARRIPLLTLQGQTEVLRELTPAAEHSWLLLLACARRLRAATEHVLAGGWERTDFPGIMLNGRTLGLIGCGRIGQWMARYAAAFGMKVLGYDPYVPEWPAGIAPVTLNELLASSDFVSLHVPMTPENAGLVTRAHFETMKPGAVVINTSRGGLVDEAALLDVLQRGHLAAAGIDVLHGEPNVQDHPLRRYAEGHANVIITPHIGGFSPDAVATVVAFAGRRILTELGLT